MVAVSERNFVDMTALQLLSEKHLLDMGLQGVCQGDVGRRDSSLPSSAKAMMACMV